MWTTHHCRHCGQIHNKSKPIGIKKRSKQQVYEYTSKHVENMPEGTRFTAEDITRCCKVYTHQIRQALHQLNLDGLVSQKHNLAPHDSTRDPWGGGPNGDSAWCASYYYRR